MEDLRGALFMVIAMGCFAVEDALIKSLSGTVPVGQVLSITCAGGLLAFILWFIIRNIPLWQPEYLHPKVLMRSGSDVIGSCLVATALTVIPLTTVSAVIQATPLVVATGAALFLGQEVGWRRWLAIGIGFAGVLIIVRPGLEGFNSAVLLAVAGMLALASRDLLTRSLRVSLSGPQLAAHTFLLIIPAGYVLSTLLGQPFVIPNARESWLLVGCIAFAIAAYLALVTATRYGNAGIISSFRYSRMVFALILGFAVFGEIPDAPTWIGTAIIIATGLFTLWREARLHRTSLASQPAL